MLTSALTVLAMPMQHVTTQSDHLYADATAALAAMDLTVQVCIG